MTEKDTVLIVDDEPHRVVKYLKKEVEDTNLQCEICVNGSSAIEFFKEHHDRVLLVFLDVQLPDNKGTDLIYDFLGVSPDAIIVIITAHFQIPEYRTDAQHKNVFEFIPKDDDFIDACSNAIEDAKLFQEFRGELACEKNRVKSSSEFWSPKYAVSLLNRFVLPNDLFPAVTFYVEPALRSLERMSRSIDLLDIRVRSDVEDDLAIVLDEVRLTPLVRLRSRNSPDQWIRDLRREEFPIQDASIVVPIQCSGGILGFLVLESTKLPFLHRLTLEMFVTRWNTLGIKLLQLCHMWDHHETRTAALRLIAHELSTCVRRLRMSKVESSEIAGVEALVATERQLTRIRNEISVMDQRSVCVEDYPPRLLVNNLVRKYSSLFADRGWELEACCEIDEFISLPLAQTRAVLENFLINAIESLESTDNSAGAVQVVGEFVNNHLIFRVRDNGQGIPTDEDPFVERSDREDGRGTGLSIVRQFAELFGAHTSYSSSPAKGSEFVFSLPVESPVAT